MGEAKRHPKKEMGFSRCPISQHNQPTESDNHLQHHIETNQPTTHPTILIIIIIIQLV